MSTGDYTTPSTGSLKIKGIGTSSKIGKPHKKKKRQITSEEKSAILSEATGSDRQQKRESENDHRRSDRKEDADRAEPADLDGIDEEEEALTRRHKTEAEIRHEERRRKGVSESPSSDGLL